MKNHQTLRRGLCVLLSLVMCLTLLPVTALAESSERVTICDTTSEDGEAYASGNVTISGELTVPGDITVSCDRLPMPSGNEIINAEYESAPSAGVEINEENFPDANFRDYVQKNFDKDSNGTLSADEIAKVTKINCSYKSIASLEGIAYFTELKELSCYINNLTVLDVSQNTALTILYCGSNKLTALSVSQNKELQKLSCNGNQLTALDVSQNMALTSLDCSDNQLTSLQLGGNTVLNYLTCGGNDLTALDVSRNTALSILRCYDNQLTVLDVSNNTKLTDLSCHTNQLTSLNLGSNTKLSSSSPIAGGNAYEIKPENGTFDLTTLPGNFDVSKASSWVGGSVSGTTLTVEKDTVLVTYNYDFGNGKSATFTLLVNDAGTEIAIDEAHFPDMVFRKYVAGSDANIDRNRDGKLSAGEIAMVKDVTIYFTNDLRDLTGIAYFTQLESLECSYCNNLRVLDVSQNTKLSELRCSYSALTSLDLNKNTALTYLDAGNNVYPIKLDENRNFDLTTLPGKFELSKASNWQGGSVSGTTLTVNSDAAKVTYDYACGNDKTVTFTLEVGYTVTAYGLYGTNLESAPGEAYVRDHNYNDWVYLEIGKRDGYTLQDLTLQGITEGDLNWEFRDEEIDDRRVSFQMPTNDVTVTANWKKNAANQAVNKKYLNTRENADSIDLAGYLPKDCGAVTYGEPQVEGDLYTAGGEPTISEGKLAYKVKAGNVGDEGTISVKVSTDLYIDYTITIHVVLIDKIPVSLAAGSSVSLLNSTLTYGEALSTLTFQSAIFVGDGNEVAGTLAWKTPDVKPDAATTKAEWVFTPTSAGYAAEEGEVEITVKKAAPNVTAYPTVAARTYHPAVALKDSDLTGGKVKSVSGNTLAGTWSWEHADVVPTVGNSGYTAVFTPNETDRANYETVTRIITVSVEPATPYCKEAPTAAAITYGDTLAAATLTGGSVQYSDSDATTVAGSFAWADSAVKPAVSDSGTTQYTVVFHPADRVNYNSVETKITLTVNKAENAPGMPESTMRVSYTKKTVGEVELPVDWSWKEEDQAKKLTVGEAKTATAVYTGADAGNYVTESVDISITRLAWTYDGEKEIRDDKGTGVYKVTDIAKKEVAYRAPADKNLTTISIPATATIDGVTYKVTSIADNAFANNKKITKVTIGSNVTTIGKKAFYKCTKLKTVKIGKNVTTISDNAFYKCTSLTKITIPSKVKKIGKQAFYGCKKLKTITIKTTKLTGKNVGSNAFKGIYSKATIKVPKSKLTSYKKLLKAKGVSSKAKIKK